MHATIIYQNNTVFAKYDFKCKLRQPAPVSAIHQSAVSQIMSIVCVELVIRHDATSRRFGACVLQHSKRIIVLRQKYRYPLQIGRTEELFVYTGCAPLYWCVHIDSKITICVYVCIRTPMVDLL